MEKVVPPFVPEGSPTTVRKEPEQPSWEPSNPMGGNVIRRPGMVAKCPGCGQPLSMCMCNH